MKRLIALLLVVPALALAQTRTNVTLETDQTVTGNKTFTGNVTTGNLTVNGTLTGNGSGLTSMNATQLTSGTVNSSRLPDAGLGAGAWGGSGKWTQIQTDAKGRVTFATDGSLGSAALSNTTDFVAASNGTATNLTINGTTTFGNATQARSALGLGTAATSNATAFQAAPSRTTFSNANYNGTTSDRLIVQTGNMTASRTVTLPLAASVPAGTPITVQDDSGTVTRFNTIVVSRNGTDSIIQSTIGGRIGGNTLTITSHSTGMTFVSDGVATWRALDAINAGLLVFPYAASGQAETGLFWNALDNGASFTMDSTKPEVRLLAPFIALGSNNYNGNTYLQLGQNAADAWYTFLSSQGGSTANRTTTASGRLVFISTYWTGSANAYRYSMTRGESDTSGNPRISFYPNSNVNVGTYDPNYFSPGNGGYAVSPGTEAARITTSGLDVLGNRVLNIGTGGLSFTGNGSADTRAALGLGTASTSNSTDYVASSNGTANGTLTVNGTLAVKSTFTSTINATALTANRTISLPDAGGTILTTATTTQDIQDLIQMPRKCLILPSEWTYQAGTGSGVSYLGTRIIDLRTGNTANSTISARCPGSNQSAYTNSQTNPTSINFAVNVCLAFRLQCNDISTDAVLRFYLGKETSSTTDGPPTTRAIGIKVVGRRIWLEAHNGSALTSVDSGYDFPNATGTTISVSVLSNGSGTVSLYVGGNFITSTSGGPTGDSGYNNGGIWASATNPSTDGVFWMIGNLFIGYL